MLTVFSFESCPAVPLVKWKVQVKFALASTVPPGEVHQTVEVFLMLIFLPTLFPSRIVPLVVPGAVVFAGRTKSRQVKDENPAHCLEAPHFEGLNTPEYHKTEAIMTKAKMAQP